MKTFFLLFSVLFLTSATPEAEKPLVTPPAPFELDEAAYTESFKMLYEEANTKFKNLQKGDGVYMEDGSGTAYEVTATMSQAREVKMLVDPENYHKYIALYPEMAELREAEALFNKILEIVIVNVPKDHKYKQAYADGYVNNLKIDVMLETEDHSALGRVPSVSLAMIYKDFAYSVEVIISAPYW